MRNPPALLKRHMHPIFPQDGVRGWRREKNAQIMDEDREVLAIMWVNDGFYVNVHYVNEGLKPSKIRVMNPEDLHSFKVYIRDVSYSI